MSYLGSGPSALVNRHGCADAHFCRGLFLNENRAWDIAAKRPVKIDIASLGISGNARFIGGPRGLDIKFGCVAAFLRGKQIRIIGQCDVNGLIRRFRHVGQRWRRFQVARLVTDQCDIVFLAADQAGARCFQIAFGDFQP